MSTARVWRHEETSIVSWSSGSSALRAVTSAQHADTLDHWKCRMRRSLALVFVVAVLGLAAWLILHRGAGSTTSAIAPNRENLASDRASSSLDAPANVDALRA